MIASNTKLGVGLYTPNEAAFYARVPTRTLNRWFFGDTQGERVASPRFGDERIISFYDFVQAMAIRNIRTNHNVPLKKIREAIDRASSEHDVSYPLARRHTIYLFHPDLYICFDASDFKKLTGTQRDQKMIKQIVEFYVDDLGYDAEGLACHYDAFTWKDRTVRMNPKLRLGEPIVTACGYSAMTLWEASQAEGSISKAAKVYGVDEADVQAAYRYIDHLSPGSSAA